MISRRALVVSLATGVLFAAGLPALAKSRGMSLIAMLDTDHDGTVDLAEAKAAASTLFDKLERDKDGTLDKHELARRLSAKELAAADPDHDGTLTKDEYLAVVAQRFGAADPDHDGTLRCQGIAKPRRPRPAATAEVAATTPLPGLIHGVNTPWNSPV